VQGELVQSSGDYRFPYRLGSLSAVIPGLQTALDTKVDEISGDSGNVLILAAGGGIADSGYAMSTVAAGNTVMTRSADGDTAVGVLTAAIGSFSGQVTSGSISTGAITASSLTNNISTQKVEVAKGGVLVGTRKRINLIEGSNVTLTVTEDAGNDEVDVTIASTGSGGAAALNDLSDVTMGGVALADKHVLYYDNATSQWINGPAASAGLAAAVHNHNDLYYTESEVNTLLSFKSTIGHEIEDHGDVAYVDTPIEGEILQRSDSDTWVNRSLSAAGIAASNHNHTLDSLSNVEITSIAAGEILWWDETNWVNVAPGDVGISEVGHTHTISDITDFAGHTHLSSEITDATSANTASMIVKRGASGEIAVGDTTVTGKVTASKRRVDGFGTIAYAATITPNCDNYNTLDVGTLTGNIQVDNPTGTPVDGQTLVLIFTQDATGGRTVTLGTSGSSNVAYGTDILSSDLPTTASKSFEVGLKWHAATSKWRVVSLVRGF
jgi:hypothetical protein